MITSEEIAESSDEYDELVKKYDKLAKKCESIKLDNERLINNICQIKKIIHKYQKQRRLLIKRLQKHKDNFRSFNYPLFIEKEETTCLSISKPKKITTLNKSNIKPKKSKTNDNKNELKIGMNSKESLPKKPINPYLIFCQENRTSVQEKYQQENNTEMSHQDLTKALAQNWHELTVNDKQVYYHLYDQQKERYENEMKVLAAKTKKFQNDSGNG